MQIGPAFRRFGAPLGLVALLVSGCSLAEDDASTPPTTAPAPDDSAAATENTSPTEPEVSDPSTDTDTDSSDRQPQADAVSLADLAGQILYRDTNGAIVVSSPTGANSVTLNDPDVAAMNAQPTWSSDGSRVAWASLSAAGPMVTTAAADGSDRLGVQAPTPAFFLAWSPDDSTIAALGPNPQGVELFFLDNTDDAITRVGSGQPFFIDWASNTSLTSAVNGTILADIPTESIDLTGRELPNPLGPFQAPAVLGPDETLVALANGASNDVAILGGAEGTDARTIALAPGPVTFSPNPVNDTVAILVNADTGQSQVIAFQIQSPVALTPNRVSIVDTNTGDVETVNIEGALATQWSPDGTTLAILLAQERGLEWRFVRDGVVLQGDPFIPSQEFFNSYVPFADQYERSSTWWSPDSRAMVFSGSIDGDDGVWVDLVDDGRAAIRVAEGDIAFWSPASRG